MSLGDRLGMLGAILALVALGITILWPDKRWIGWLALGGAVCLLIGWGWLEIGSDIPQLRFQYPKLAASVVFVVGGCLALALWQLVVPKNPVHTGTGENAIDLPGLGVFAVASAAIYPQGYEVANIKWSPRFTELRVTLRNSSSVPLKDIDVMLRPDMPIAEIAQSSNVPNVYFTPPTVLTTQQELIDQNTGKRFVNPLVLIATEEAYRVHCDNLPSKEQLQIVMAIAEPDDGPRPSPQGVFARDYVMRVKNNQTGASNWFGHGSDHAGRVEEAYKFNRVTAKNLEVKGSYKANDVLRYLSENIQTPDLVGDAVSKIRGK